MEKEEGESEIEKLEKLFEGKILPEEVQKTVEDELNKLRTLWIPSAACPGVSTPKTMQISKPPVQF
jgi:ATP-dependent Lon protease